LFPANPKKCFVSGRTDYRREGSKGSGGSYSGTGYDRWSYEQSAPGANDTALNKLQHKYWVAKQARLFLLLFLPKCSRINFYRTEKSEAIAPCKVMPVISVNKGLDKKIAIGNVG
jgi:hypothetical protein